MFTDEEYKAYLKVKKEYLKKDIKSCCEVEPTEEQLEKLCERIEKTLSNNDSYWESYWLSVEYNIRELMKGKNAAHN